MSGCPNCGRRGRVVDSRARRRVRGIRRRRECLVCALRWTTWEVAWNVERVVELLEAYEQSQKRLSRHVMQEMQRSAPIKIEEDLHDTAGPSGARR